MLVMPDIALARDAGTFARFAALAAEYEHALPPALRHANFETEAADIRAAYGPPNAAFVASIEGEPCGCVALVRLDARTAVVKKMYVRPAFRHRGIARALMEALETHARAGGYERLALDTDREALAAAYRLYLTLGFSDCEPYGEVDYDTPAFMERWLK